MVYKINLFIRTFNEETMETTVTTKRSNHSFSPRMKMEVLRYVVICAFLAVVNWLTNPAYWWVLWVMAGWGINLVLSIVGHYVMGGEKENKKTINQ